MKKTNNLKRIASLIISFIILLSFTSFAAETSATGGSSDSMQIAKGFGVINKESESSPMSKEILEYAYKAITAADFSAEEKCDTEAVSKMFVELLGYEIKKNDSNTYRSILNSLGGFKGVSISDSCTVGSFAKIFTNALDMKLLELKITSKGNSYEVSDITFANRYFSVSKYSITVTEVLGSEIYVKATVNDVMDSENISGYSKGRSYSMTFSDTSLLSSFKNVELTAYINKDNEIVYWYPAKTSNIVYSYISAVNGSENETRSYYGKYISTIKLKDKKYSVAKGSVILYNEKNAYSTANPYVGHFAKAVTDGDQITRLEVYTLDDGGIFKALAADSFSFTKGTGQVKKIKNLDLFEEVNVIIDGNAATLDNLKENMVVDIYKTDSRLLVCASAFIITDTLTEISTKYINLSGSKYCISTAYGAYFSETDGRFSGKKDGFSLLNTYCSVYFDYKGEVRFVEFNKGDINRDFYAILTGISADSGDAFEDGIYKLRFFKLADGGCDEVIAKTKDDIVLPDTIANISLTFNDRNNMEKNIYLLKANEDGIITSMKKAEDVCEVFMSQNNDHISIGNNGISATGSDDSLFSQWTSDRKDVYAVTIVDGKTKVQSFDSNFPGGIRYGQVSFCYVVPEMASKADIVLCWSTLYDDGIMYSHGSHIGIVTEVSTAYDTAKEKTLNRYTIMKTDGTTFNLDAPSGSEFDILEKGTVFSYKSDTIFAEYPIYFGPIEPSFNRPTGNMLKFNILEPSIYTNALDYTDYIDSEKANGVSNKDLDVVTNKTQIYKDTVYMYGDNRIWFGAKNLYGANTVTNLPVFKINIAGKSFEIVDSSEISEGDEIYFYFNSSRVIDFAFILE